VAVAGSSNPPERVATLERKLALKGRPLEVRGAPSGLALPVRREGGPERAILVFVRDRAELSTAAGGILESAKANRLTWVAYPKAGQLGTDLNRDSLATLLEKEGIRPVTQVAIDETWSALRFRPARVT